MPLDGKLLKEWHVYATRHGFEANLTLNNDGLVLGKTLLAPFRKGKLVFDPQCLATLLAAAYAEPLPPNFFRAVHHAEKCYERDEITLALMHLALTGLPGIDLEKAQRLFVAEWAMARGVTPAQLLKLAGLPKDDDGEDEDNDEDGGDDNSDPDSNDDSDDSSGFDSKHPRWPAGSPGGIGGEFAPKDTGDATGALHDAISQNAQSSNPLDPDSAWAALTSGIGRPSQLGDGTIVAGDNAALNAKDVEIDGYDPDRPWDSPSSQIYLPLFPGTLLQELIGEGTVSTTVTDPSAFAAVTTDTATSASVTIKVPLGFESQEQFIQAVSELKNALYESEIDGTIGIRGSSITGISLSTGRAFGVESDIDFFIESANLTEGFATSKNIPGFVYPNEIQSEYEAINTWAKDWSVKLGRKVSVGGFQPGTVPLGDILWP